MSQVRITILTRDIEQRDAVIAFIKGEHQVKPVGVTNRIMVEDNVVFIDYNAHEELFLMDLFTDRGAAYTALINEKVDSGQHWLQAAKTVGEEYMTLQELTRIHNGLTLIVEDKVYGITLSQGNVDFYTGVI